MIKGIVAWLDDRSGLVTAMRRALEHPVPPRTGWWYVFGSATLLAFVLQVLTGIALATAYVPSSGQAYDSLRFILPVEPIARMSILPHFRASGSNSPGG